MAAYEYAQLDELYKRAEERNEQPFFLILDELEDPHNLGSIMRTADAVGAHGIVIPKRRAVGLTSTVAKASTGAIEHIPVVKVTNLARTLDEMKERGDLGRRNGCIRPGRLPLYGRQDAFGARYRKRRQRNGPACEREM